LKTLILKKNLKIIEEEEEEEEKDIGIIIFLGQMGIKIGGIIIIHIITLGL